MDLFVRVFLGWSNGFLCLGNVEVGVILMVRGFLKIGWKFFNII